VRDVCHEHTSAHNVFQRKSGADKNGFDFLKNALGLQVKVAATHGAVFVGGNRTRDLKLVSNLHSTGVSNNIFPFRAGGKIYSVLHEFNF
jgi:hypothetical protein